MPNLLSLSDGRKANLPLDNNGRIVAYDDEGYRVPLTDIPDEVYFGEAFEPDPTEAEEGALALAHAAVERVIRLAREVVWSAMGDFDAGCKMPPATNSAIGDLDDALTALETIVDVATEEEAGRWGERLAAFNEERTDAPRGGRITDRDIISAGLPVG